MIEALAKWSNKFDQIKIIRPQNVRAPRERAQNILTVAGHTKESPQREKNRNVFLFDRMFDQKQSGQMVKFLGKEHISRLAKAYSLTFFLNTVKIN